MNSEYENFGSFDEGDSGPAPLSDIVVTNPSLLCMRFSTDPRNRS